MSATTQDPPAGFAETPSGVDPEPDPDTGKLFDVPRVNVIVDDTDPTLLKLAFNGSVEIERGDKEWVDFYNTLRHGRSSDLTVTVHVAGTKKTHRRDSEGDVDAIVETKSLTVTDIQHR